MLLDPASARKGGIGTGAYTDPANLTNESIEYYIAPLVSSPLRKAQANQYAVAFDPNPLLAIEPELRRSTAPVRMVWGMGDHPFPVSGAEWLDRTLPGSRGVRLVEGAKLIFPEEMPDIIAEEARALWQ